MKKVLKYVLTGLLCLVLLENSGMVTYAESEGLQSPKSEQFENLKLEDGIEFAMNTYQEFMRYFLVRCRKLESLKVRDIENTEIGKPFLLYNVDGRQQPAYVYLPLYLDGKAVHIINALEYEDGYWQYGPGPIAFLIAENQADILNQIGYKDKECIFYSINNTCYVESEDERLIITAANARDENVYSKEEEAFLKMSFQEKKKMVQKGLESLCDVSNYDEFDEDVQKQLTGEYAGENEDKEKENTVMTKVLVILGIIVTVSVIAAIGKVFYEKRKRASENSGQKKSTEQ